MKTPELQRADPAIVAAEKAISVAEESVRQKQMTCNRAEAPDAIPEPLPPFNDAEAAFAIEVATQDDQVTGKSTAPSVRAKFADLRKRHEQAVAANEAKRTAAVAARETARNCLVAAEHVLVGARNRREEVLAAKAQELEPTLQAECIAESKALHERNCLRAEVFTAARGLGAQHRHPVTELPVPFVDRNPSPEVIAAIEAAGAILHHRNGVPTMLFGPRP